MNFDEAMSEAVLGARVTCDFIGEGVYVAYNFNGWRIHHGDMASSGFAWRDEHKAAEWRIVETPCDHVFVEGAEGAFAGLTHHCVRCGVEAAPKPKPNVWGRPRIALGEAGVPEHNGMYPDKVVDLSLPKNDAKLAVCRCGSKIAAAFCCGTPAIDQGNKPAQTLYASMKGGGKSRSQFYNPKLAEAITTTGQETLRALERASDQAKDLGNVNRDFGKMARKPPNVGTSPAPSGFELARLEAAKESEPLPEPSKPASAWAWGKK